MADKSSDGQEGQISIRILSLRKIWIEDEGCEETSSFLRNSCSVGIFAKTGAYGINLMEVTSTNVALNKRKLDEKPLVIVYNSGKIQNELDENIEQFLEKAKEKQADIWPVAFSKEARKPVDNISKKQSYDIWEQLRCRGLDKIHISAIAKAFSRKIIATGTDDYLLTILKQLRLN